MGGRLQARGGEKLPLIMAVTKASIKLHFVTHLSDGITKCPPVPGKGRPSVAVIPFQLFWLLFSSKTYYGTERMRTRRYPGIKRRKRR